MRKKILISIGIFFIIIILALVGLLFLSQTQYFRNIARTTAEGIVSSTTGQTFTIGGLEGNFFNNITLSDVSFIVEGENFVSVKEITLDYALIHMLNNTTLFSKAIPVDELLITGLDVNLIKYSDGAWNFEKIGSSEDPKPEDQESTPPAWTIILSKFLLTDAQITTDDRAENKVSKYEIPEVDLSIKLIDIYRAIDLDLKNAAFNAPGQNLSITGLSTKAYYSEEKVSIENLKVLFNDAEIKLNAEAENLTDKPKFSFDASANNFVIENIGTVNLETKGSGQYISSNDIRANATIKIPESEILQKKISGTLEEISMSGTTINISGGNFDSDLGVIKLDGDIDLNKIISKTGNNNFDITLSLNNIKTTEIFSLLEAATNTPSELPIDIQLGAVLNSEIKATGNWEEFSDLGVKADIKKFEIKGEQAGNLQLSGTADYSSSGAGVDINLNLAEVNLGSILADQNFYSKITSKFDIQAKIPLQGNLLENLSADIEGSFEPSSIFGINLTDGVVDVSYENQILDIKSLALNAEKNKLVVSGKSPQKLGADFTYDIEVEDLSFISGISPDLAISGTLKAAGDVTGSLNNPDITIDGEVLNFSMDEKYSAKSIKIDGSGTLSNQDPELKAKLNVATLKINRKEIREIVLDVTSEGAAINADLNIIEDDQFQYKMKASLLDLSSTQKDIQISELVLKLEDTTLDNRDNILLTIAPSSFVLQNFNLYHNNSSALADANISNNGNIDGSLKLSNLDLDDITKALEFQTPLQGTINANIELQGTMQNPAINANIQTQNLQYNDFDNDNIRFDLNYLNQNMDLNFVISNDSVDILSAKGSSNINLNLNQIGESVENASINLSIDSSGLNLSPLSSLVDDVVKSEGELIIDLNASGKLKTPTVNGKIELQEAKLQTKTIRNEIGIPKAIIELNGQKAVLQTLELTTGNGSASFQGELDIPTFSYTLSGDLDNFLIKPERISAALTGDLSVKGEGEKVDISGKITVEKAKITIPDSEPKEIPEIQYVDAEQDEFEVESGQEENYFDKNVALNMQVKMIRNNWVKGQGANIELKGDLDIKKNYSQSLRIIGDINVIRGTYDNFGKVFRIEEGNVSFSGGQEIDPFLDITALYRVSSNNIYINISGRASEPKIALTSDPAMSETDIVSFLIFGASSSDISSGERSAAGGIASGLAGGIAAAQLQRLMGNAVSLDVVSISGTNLEVGKYLTEDLYIAYERGTTDSIIASTNITYNKMIVEYRIFKNVTIDADVGGENPGADLFYNFNF
jgi:translocation and assembly module TamB